MQYKEGDIVIFKYIGDSTGTLEVGRIVHEFVMDNIICLRIQPLDLFLKNSEETFIRADMVLRLATDKEVLYYIVRDLRREFLELETLP